MSIFFFDQVFPKREFPVKNGKTVLVRASMAVPYYIELFSTGANRHNCISVFLLLLVAETTTLMADYEFHFMKS